MPFKDVLELPDLGFKATCVLKNVAPFHQKAKQEEMTVASLVELTKCTCMPVNTKDWDWAITKLDPKIVIIPICVSAKIMKF